MLMVDISLTEEQISMQKMARDFTKKEIVPISKELDQAYEIKFNWEIYRKLAQKNFNALMIPERYGGAGLDCLSSTVIVEELAVGCAGIAFTSASNFVTAFPIISAGNDEQKDRFLPIFCDKVSPKLSGFALTEPDAGSDVSGILTSARLTGENYLLNGRKCFISNAGLSSLYIVFAYTNKSLGVKGISAFIIPGDSEGITIGKIENKMGFRASQTAELVLDNVSVPRSNLLGEEGRGFRIALKGLDLARIVTGGAISVGVARAAYEVALQYSKERIQFGKSIFENQIISFMLADMIINIEAGRLLVWKAAYLMDRGLPFTRESAIAKVFSSDAAMKITTDAVQILGGYGYMKDYPVEKYMRDAKLLQIYDGTNQIQRVVISNLL
jgi:alkylation response protein AidB-like acyl-CoA dehydrogenase